MIIYILYILLSWEAVWKPQVEWEQFSDGDFWQKQREIMQPSFHHTWHWQPWLKDTASRCPPMRGLISCRA